MSDTVLGWLFGGWSFGRSSDETGIGREHARPYDNREIDERIGVRETGDDHPDDRLVAQVRAGDPVALDTLFRRYYDSLVRFATSYVRSIDLGEEVVADVFARLWEHRATWTTSAGVAAYLFGAVRNGALNVVKSRVRELRRTTTLYAFGERPEIAAPSLTAAEQVERDDYTATALRLMAKLPERRRLILSLRWNYALTWDEIAAVLGVTAAAAQREHSRILASLRAELQAM